MGGIFSCNVAPTWRDEVSMHLNSEAQKFRAGLITLKSPDLVRENPTVIMSGLFTVSHVTMHSLSCIGQELPTEIPIPCRNIGVIFAER